jgi:hypothetical protein
LDAKAKEAEMNERLRLLKEAAKTADTEKLAAEQEKLMIENLKLKEQNEQLAAKVGHEKVVVKEP